MHTIMNYTIMPNEVITIFKPRDIYTLAVLYLYAIDEVRINNKNYYVTDLTIKQIATYGNLTEDYITKQFLPRLRDSKFGFVETTQMRYKIKRNIFKLPKPNKNFRIIHKDILNDPLESELKGFLISLFCCCDSNTLHCRYDFNQVTDSIIISRNTFFRYKKELEGKYLFYGKITSIYGSQYSSGIDIRCSWLRIQPEIDSSMDTYMNPYIESLVELL